MLKKPDNSRLNGKITSFCLAVAGRHEGFNYDGIKVIPLLKEEKILIAVKVKDNQLKTVADVDFPADEQTHERFQKILKRAIGKTLQVLI